MRLRKRLLALFCAALFLCAMGATAYAHDVPDLARKGSIQIAMEEGKTVVPGGTLTLYRVGLVQERDGDYSFTPTGEFAGCGESLENPQSEQLAKKLAGYAKDHSLVGTTKEIGADGVVSFNDLELGLYLLVQNEAASGYNKVDPFLVSVPMLEDGQYVYDVNASPKVELEKEPSPTPSTPPKTPSTPSKPGLPQTGQLNWPVPVLVVLGLCLFSAGWALRFGRKKGGYEK